MKTKDPSPGSLAIATLEEAKNGWTTESLNQYLEATIPNEMQRRHEILNRHLARAGELVAMIDELQQYDLNVPLTAKTLADLRGDLASVKKDVEGARKLYEEVKARG